MSLTCTIIAVDPGLTNTGVAIYRLQEHKVKLLKRCKIPTDSHVADDLRIRFIVGKVLEYVKYYSTLPGPSLVVIEEADKTIYNQGKGNRLAMLARAKAMFQVYGLVYALTIAMYLKGYSYRLISPREWQPSKAQRGGLDTKTWSLNQAKAFLRNKFQVAGPLKLDHNIADAINMGFKAVQLIESGKWSLQCQPEAVEIETGV